ncbi:polysaccharide deacetylase family protein [Mesorhizobium sp. 1B3]|uniref:polysaccharide deacetylase family protein n=1 Tax=Mesorhizobium sp. 1B3 TaxID=3243599 RepID=UPI003D98312C
MKHFRAVSAELDIWRDEGLQARFWLRDDDATEPSDRLDRLIDLVRRFDVPLLLAVIPALATAALADRLSDELLVTSCTHGYAHRNHMPEGQKAVELAGRDVEAELAELTSGRRRLLGLFPGSLSGILVPPWNRIAPELAARVHECGFTALSTWSWQRTGTTLPELNTQIDVMNWTGGRTGHGPEAIADELLRRLRQARGRGGAPLGILSHHLVHDESAWSTLEALISYLRLERGLSFHEADELVRSSRPASLTQD